MLALMRALAKARRLSADIRAGLEEVRRRAGKRPKRSVLFIVGRTPGTLQALVAAGRGSYLNEVMTLAGGRNVLADSPVSYPKISIETVLALKPEVIIDTVSEAGELAVRELWKQIPIAARVYSASGEIFVVPGPRVVDAALAFERMFRGM